ncbi:MAG: hypothetical protein H7Z11_12015 [Verrucomicrobia bacterium]|nr:hypothetical protein [Leptolyngbya sp. ES-bin-22]
MNQPDEPQPLTAQPTDIAFQQDVERLYRLTLYGRWGVVVILWLTIGLLSLWGLRYPISLLLDYFTWAAVRYGLAFNRLPAIGLATCIGFTVAVLLQQSRNELFGLSQRDQQRLEQQVQRIRLQGSSHPLWRFVCQPK